MNTELLLKVKEKILAQPRAFNMATWLRKNGPEGGDDPYVNYRNPPCGTVACIAGWVVELTGGRMAGRSVSELAKDRLLADTTLERGQAEALFLLDWPADLKKEFDGIAGDDVEHWEAEASVAAKAINRFIEDPSEFLSAAQLYEQAQDDDDHGAADDL